MAPTNVGGYEGFSKAGRGAFGFFRLGHEDHAEAAFANLLKQRVAADAGAGSFRERSCGESRGFAGQEIDGRTLVVGLQESTGLLVRVQECLDALTEGAVARASTVEAGIARGLRGVGQGFL